ncbi:MAG TPA: hypothetical protein ENK51_07165 [Gammaproteobacteria bacterium]|nr:hypothetical protein [Gammaproteobacteria bacterium]
MTTLLLLFIDLCRLRRGPQDVPASRFLMMLTAGGYFVIGLAVSLLEQPPGLAILSAAVDTLMLAALAWLSLWIIGKTARFTQTYTALAGIGILFGLMGWPLVAFLQGLPQGQGSSLSLLLLGLVIWNIVVIGHILRHALGLMMWAASGLALFYVYLSIRVMSALYIAGT